jgi:hypothetical protein
LGPADVVFVSNHYGNYNIFLDPSSGAAAKPAVPTKATAAAAKPAAAVVAMDLTSGHWQVLNLTVAHLRQQRRALLHPLDQP